MRSRRGAWHALGISPARTLARHESSQGARIPPCPRLQSGLLALPPCPALRRAGHHIAPRTRRSSGRHGAPTHMAAGRKQGVCFAAVRCAGLACAPWLCRCPGNHQGHAPGRMARPLGRYTTGGVSYGHCQGAQRAKRTTDANRFHPHLGRPVGGFYKAPSKRLQLLAACLPMSERGTGYRLLCASTLILVSTWPALSTNFTARGNLRAAKQL